MPNLARVKKICRSVAYALCARLRLSEIYSVNKFTVVSNCLINSSRILTNKDNSKVLKKLLTILDDSMHFESSVENIAAIDQSGGNTTENGSGESVSESTVPIDIDSGIPSITDTSDAFPGTPPEVLTPCIISDGFELSTEDVAFLTEEGLPLLGFTDPGLQNIIITGFASIKDLFLGFIGVVTSDNYSALTRHFIKTIKYKIHRILVSLRQGITIPAEFFNYRINDRRLMRISNIINANQTVDDTDKLFKHREFILTNIKAVETREHDIVYDENYEEISKKCKHFIDHVILCVSRKFELVSRYGTVVDEMGNMSAVDKPQTDKCLYNIIENIQSEWDSLSDIKNSFVYYVCFRELYRFTHNVGIILKNIRMLTTPVRIHGEIKEKEAERDEDEAY